jgi:hypothetical protein
MVSKKYEILTTGSRHREGLYQILAPNSKVWLPDMSEEYTGHVWYGRADSGWNRFKDQKSTKSTRINLKLCRDFLGTIDKISSEYQYPKPRKSQAIPKSIKKGGVFSKFLKRVDFRARVESAQTTWWEWFSGVLAHFDPTQRIPKAQIQRNHQNQGKGDTGRGRTPKPNQTKLTQILKPRGQEEVKASITT